MPWDPGQYLKFKEERFAPFEDLLSLVRIRNGLSVIDLGCGTGELTARIADRLPGSSVQGVDSSPDMIHQGDAFARPGISFAQGAIEEVVGTWDLVISNAALHWVEDHRALIPRLLSLVARGGQLAVQIPANHRHRAHTAILDTAREEPFHTALGGWVRQSPVMEIDEYAELLYAHGGRELVVFEKVYPHVLPDADAVAQWTAGSTLVPYFERLPEVLHEQFMARYRDTLRCFWPRGPVLYTFRRIFFSAVAA